jgi:hypothetical protein
MHCLLLDGQHVRYNHRRIELTCERKQQQHQQQHQQQQQ